MPTRIGFGQFAPVKRAPMFSSRDRAKLSGSAPPAVIEENELYAD
jgi:hypothetical protein